MAAAIAPTGAPANDAAEIVAAALAAVMLAEFAGDEVNGAWAVGAKSRGGGRPTPGGAGYCRGYGTYIDIGGCGSSSCCGGEEEEEGDAAAIPAVALLAQFCSGWWPRWVNRWWPPTGTGPPRPPAAAAAAAAVAMATAAAAISAIVGTGSGPVVAIGIAIGNLGVAAGEVTPTALAVPPCLPPRAPLPSSPSVTLFLFPGDRDDVGEPGAETVAAAIAAAVSLISDDEAAAIVAASGIGLLIVTALAASAAGAEDEAAAATATEAAAAVAELEGAEAVLLVLLLPLLLLEAVVTVRGVLLGATLAIGSALTLAVVVTALIAPVGGDETNDRAFCCAPDQDAPDETNSGGVSCRCPCWCCCRCCCCWCCCGWVGTPAIWRESGGICCWCCFCCCLPPGSPPLPALLAAATADASLSSPPPPLPSTVSGYLKPGNPAGVAAPGLVAPPPLCVADATPIETADGAPHPGVGVWGCRYWGGCNGCASVGKT